MRATSHTRLKARHQCILRSLIGPKDYDHPSSLHTRKWKPKGPKIFSWTKSSHGFPHGILWIMFYGLSKFASYPPSKGRPDTNSCKPYKSQTPYTTSTAFEWESVALTITWSQPLVHAWSDLRVFKVSLPHGSSASLGFQWCKGLRSE